MYIHVLRAPHRKWVIKYSCKRSEDNVLNGLQFDADNWLKLLWNLVDLQQHKQD